MTNWAVKYLLVPFIIVCALVFLHNRNTRDTYSGAVCYSTKILYTHFLNMNKFPNGRLSQIDYAKNRFGDRFLLDPWGASYISRPDDGGIIYSIGKDKIDDKGFGDDISCK